MRRRKAGLGLALGMVLGVTGLMAWAWLDAGRVPVRPISIALAVPDLPR